ncbi:MAG: hypothetical protein JXM74_07195, partial [Fusobacteriaceae bacterium]|nr:hypothetical protein [Fusobacteriaceae bacterium]
LAEIKKDVATERAISDSLTVNSKDEPVENQNATEYGDKKKTLLEKTKDYAVEKGNEFVLHLKETDWLDTINRSLDYPKGLLLGAGESATFGYTNFIEDHISIYDKETYYFGKFSGNYLVGSILSEGGKAGGITLTLSGAGSVVGVSVFSYSEAVQLYSVGAIASNSVLMVNSGGDEGKNNVSDYNTWNKGTFNSSKETINYHFKKHGKEVGAESVEQYMKKAEAFKNNLKGAKKSDVKGKVKGVIRYKKNGKYIDIAPDGSIISFGKQ